MTLYEQMVPALSALLDKDGTLKAPIYGTLLQKSKGKQPGSLNSIRQAKVHKSLIPLRYTVRLYLVDGTMIKFRIPKKVYGFATQEENLDNFLTKIKTYT